MGLTYIIIVTYNAMPWLEKCLGSIDFDQFKVVVVDNNSSDETVATIKQNHPHIKLFEEKENLGFGQANNKGISYALNQGAEHVYLLNQDAYLIGECLAQLLYTQHKYPNYGIVSPIHTNAEVTRLDRNFSNYVRYDINPDFYSDFVLGKKKKPIYDVPFVNAAGWLISKECLMNVGGFDPIFFHYGEDDNYCQRVHYHGFKIGVVPTSFMVHDREDREKPVVQNYSEAYFKIQDRRLKIKFGNLNAYDEGQLSDHKKKVKRQLLKARIRRNKKAITGLKRQLQLIDKVSDEIKKSIELNKKKHPNYLNL